MAGGAGSTVAHLQAGGARGVGQLEDLGLGCEVQGLGGFLRETQRQRVRDTKGGPPQRDRGDKHAQNSQGGSQPTSPAGEWAERYLQRVVGGHGPRPLHSRGLGAVQELERIFHCGEGGKEKSPG